MERRFDESLILEVLEHSAERVSTGWTSGHQARTSDGDPVPPEHPFASSFCCFGAIRAECLSRLPDDRSAALLLAETSAKYLGAMLKHLGQQVRQSAPQTLMEWNDAPGRSRDEVVGVFLRTVSSLSRRLDAARLAA